MRSSKLPAALRALAAVLAMTTLAPLVAHAEKADKEKPTEIESNRMMSDDARQMTIFAALPPAWAAAPRRAPARR